MIERRPDSAATVHATRSVTDLLQDTAAHTENVVRGEIRLAVVRLQEQVAAKTKRVVLLVMSGVLGLVGLVVLLNAAIMRLSQEMEPWLATLIVGLLVAAMALVLAVLPTRVNGAET